MAFTELKMETKNKTITLTLGGHRPKIVTTKMKCNLSLSLSLSLSCEAIGKKNANDVRCGALQRPLLLVKVIILFCDLDKLQWFCFVLFRFGFFYIFLGGGG